MTGGRDVTGSENDNVVYSLITLSVSSFFCILKLRQFLVLYLVLMSFCLVVQFPYNTLLKSLHLGGTEEVRMAFIKVGSNDKTSFSHRG